MGRSGYVIRDQKELHFVTFTVVRWVDIFSKTIYKNIIIDNFRFYIKNQGLKVHGYVIMSNHLHAILSASEGKNDLSSVIGRFKSMTCKQIIATIQKGSESRKYRLLAMFRKAAVKNKRNKSFQVWQQHNHPIELFNVAIAQQKLDYIHNNPVKAGLVDKQEDYLYSSARRYAGLQGFLSIDFLELGLNNA